MIIGKATKQPAEIQSYSVTYDNDLNPNEDVTTAYHAIYVERRLVEKVTKAVDYTAVAADAFKLFKLEAGATLTIPSGLAADTEFYVSNFDSASDASVACDELIDGSATLEVGINRSFVIKRIDGTWVTVVNGTNVVVNTPTDHRVRVFFDGGEDRTVYITEVTADTDEGRRLQDELRITVKET